MIRTLVVADSGSVLAAMTSTLCRLEQVDIVAYASGRSHLDAIVRAIGPDVALIDEMRKPGQALARIAEVRAAQPFAAVVGLTDRPDGAWVAEALRAGATAVVPRDLAPETLGLVLREALDAPHVLPASEREAA
jgi:two-component system nitrate/nitrite response regulator NarL